jgi:hypothetical protein
MVWPRFMPGSWWGEKFADFIIRVHLDSANGARPEHEPVVVRLNRRDKAGILNF